MSDAINGDLSLRASVETNDMQWTPSPSRTVWRKRVHLVGPPESGQVTSVVRYEPEAEFPAHDHPQGEEILVLQGVFSDEHGDWPVGTYLLNPEGFRHAPSSPDGCVLFVKLRQFAGAGRDHVVVDTRAMHWQPSPLEGVACKPLYAQAGFADTMQLERWEAGAQPGAIVHPAGAEFFVLDGAFEDEAGTYRSGAWLRLPVGSCHRPRSPDGCTLYVKRGGLPGLASATP